MNKIVIGNEEKKNEAMNSDRDSERTEEQNKCINCNKDIINNLSGWCDKCWKTLGDRGKREVMQKMNSIQMKKAGVLI